MVRLGAWAAAAAIGVAVSGLAFAQASAQPAAGSPPPTAAPAAGAATAEAAPATKAADLGKGRELFNSWGCSTCHTLSDAGASGQVGPMLDGNKALTHDLIVNRITNGAGAMPAFGGQMTDQEIAALANYVDQVHAK